MQDLAPHTDHSSSVGKSVLASSMIDRCMSVRESNILAETPGSHAQTGATSDYSDTLVSNTSYFYCREEGSRQNDSLVIYKSLLRQMLRGSQDLLPVCHEKMVKGQGPHIQETTAQTLLELFVNTNLNRYIILDGIDSCEVKTRGIVIDFLSKLVSRCEENKPGKVRLLLISHDLLDVRKLKLIESSTTIIDVTTNFVQTDIGHYLDSCIPRLKTCGLDAGDISRVQSKVLKRSDGELAATQQAGVLTMLTIELGSFLYAQMVMDNLFAQRTVGELLAELEERRFPADLASA